MICGTLLFLGFIYFLYQDDIDKNGKSYTNKEKMCKHFALSYLRSIQKVEPEFNDQKWRMAIDVETDLHNLCMTDLNSVGLANYKSKVLEKYP